MRFSWKLALVRWLKGALMGAGEGLALVQVAQLDVRMIWIPIAANVLNAAIQDIDAYLKASERADQHVAGEVVRMSLERRNSELAQEVRSLREKAKAAPVRGKGGKFTRRDG